MKTGQYLKWSEWKRYNKDVYFSSGALQVADDLMIMIYLKKNFLKYN